ncbi:hypothetical protein P691DRAFT_813368 [Macrolepiota fuliginosa MF-IS2]|uniref:Uncharacterized protein n=1 Tax=Macrolepiota fuliginosa MF-IS2 TaxID=1400762 RepID=A0A9P5XG74_9AGAR|nr:hypothetical protein P691DRAFT_813368 [Macrolepiota fuliginosa MF-IS2]
MLTRTNSAVAARRTGSLTLRVRGKPPGSQHRFQPIGPYFPLEIVEAIIGFVLSSLPNHTSFLAIIAFAQTSRALREIALRQYCRDVIVNSRVMFVKLWNFLSAENDIFRGIDKFIWVKSLSAPSHIITRSIKSLGAFINLRNLEVCFATEGLRTQDSLVELLLDSFADSPARTNMKKLALTDIPRIDNKLLGSVAKVFSGLKVLELTSTNRLDFDCCLICLEDSLSYTRHSLIPEYSPTAEKLAVDVLFTSTWATAELIICDF